MNIEGLASEKTFTAAFTTLHDYLFIKCVHVGIYFVDKGVLKNWQKNKQTKKRKDTLKTVSGNEEILLKIVASI